MYEFSREMQGNAVYMVLRLQAADELDNMALGMLLNNRIPGILPVSKRWEKQGFALYYTISSLTPMEHCAGLLTDARRMTQFLRSFCVMLMECEEYLLEESGLLLDPASIFVKAATGEIAVPYLPLLHPETGKTAKAFLDEVIRMTVRQLPQDSALVNLLFRESFQETFVPAEFLARLDQLNAQKAAPARQQTAYGAPAPAPAPEPAPAPAPAAAPVPAQPELPAEAFVPEPDRDFGPAPKKRGLFDFGAKKDKSEKAKPEKAKKKKERRSDEPDFDNPFATGGKIPPRGPIADLPPEDDAEPVPEAEPERKRKGFGGLFGHGAGKEPPRQAEPVFDSPFASAQSKAAPVSAPAQPPVQQAYGSVPSAAGGHTINMAGLVGGAPQGTMPMMLGDDPGAQADPSRGAWPAERFPIFWLEEKATGNRVQITHNNFHVGRKLDTDDIVDYAVITATPYMGSDHCYFLCKAGQLYIVDNNSANGTWVDGQRIEPGVEVPVTSGAVIRMADITFILQKR